MGSQLFHVYHIFSEDTVYQSRLEICVFILAKATKLNLDRFNVQTKSQYWKLSVC